MSARDNGVVVDVGLKGIACDFGPPTVQGSSGCDEFDTRPRNTFRWIASQPNIGDQVRLVPSHGCTTSSLYRKMWITRDNVIVDVWDIEGAGCLE